MYTTKKAVAVLLVVTVAFSVFFTGCVTEDVKGLFSRLFGGSKDKEVTSEARLPDRPYIIDEDDDKEKPDSLSEYLEEPEGGANEVLSNEILEEDILAAQSLDEVADSKTEVDNLRKLKNNMLAMAGQIEDSGDPSDRQVKDRIIRLTEKIDSLFLKGKLTPGQMKAGTSFKGTWTKPDRVLLRWTPQNEWVPDDGYRLFRVLDGKTELLAEGLGTESHIDKAASSGREYAEYIKPLFDKAALNTEALQAAGVATKEEFNQLVYKEAAPPVSYRFSGAEDFQRSKQARFSIKGSLADRLPRQDSFNSRSLHIISEINAAPLSIKSITYAAQIEPQNPAVPGSIVQSSEIISELMDNRNNILTKANLDMQFAGDAGFGYEDRLEGMGIKKNTPIEYVLVPRKPSLKAVNKAAVSSGNRPEGTYSVEVSYGVETPVETPQELIGFGADNVVNLRWTPPLDNYAKSIISGYYIERKKNGEGEFERLNSVPVAISYTADEDGILYETPVFYMDEDIQNGDEAVFRVQALDIFGRVSGYSNNLDIKVYKVTAPNPPNLGQPSLSTGRLARAGAHIKESASLNKGKTGVILPIAKTSQDTDEFAVFRSRALGSGSFEDPVEIARVQVEKEETDYSKKIVKYGKVKLLVNPDTSEDVHTVYFDAGIEKGYYYKYWVAAVDDWGNESIWSSSRVVGYPTDEKPEMPVEPNADVIHNTQPAALIDIPGFSTERFIGSSDENDSSGDTDVKKTDYIKGLKASKVSIGLSVSKSVRKDLKLVPDKLSLEFINLPDTRDIHDIIALEDSDILPGGKAQVSWYHYAGENLSGYHVYRAYVDGKTVQELEELSRDEIVQSFTWNKVAQNSKYNQIMDTVQQKDGRVYLYLVFLVPENIESSDNQGFNIFEPGGFVKLSWKAPKEPQIGYYRVYRAEVPYFEEGQDTDDIEWTLVADNLSYTGYSEKVDQTFARYYYYKITSVSVWGVESEDGTVAKIRVPATVPPRTPSMLLPFSQKGKVQVNWVGVPHASKYVVYRHKLPGIREEDVLQLENLSPVLFDKVFTPRALNDDFLTQRMIPDLGSGIRGGKAPKTSRAGERNTTVSITQDTALPLVTRFNTVQLASKETIMHNIGQVSVKDKVSIYQDIQKKYGVLSLIPYGQLDLEMAKLILWDKVHEVEIPLGQESTGTFKFIDEDVLFGDTCLYTVQAVNDDDLASGRPDPVTVSPRKSSPFPPVTGLKGEIDEKIGKPILTWNTAKDPNLSWKESREHIAGYIVYKSRTSNGTYYQASEFLTDPSFLDREADSYSANWYKVRVVDTGGFISDFSEAVKVQKAPDFLIPKINIKTIVPKVNINPGSRYGYDRQDETVNALAPLKLKPLKPIPLLPDTLTINGFTIEGISGDTLQNGKGPGLLKLGEGFEIEMELDITKWQGTAITQGTATLKQPVTFEDSGVYLSRLLISTAKAGATVSGYVKSTSSDNLIGDLYALRFEDQQITASGIIKISTVPVFHYDNLTFTDANMITVNLTGTQDTTEMSNSLKAVIINELVYESSFITLIGGHVENNLGMETLDNKGLRLAYSMTGFDMQGKLNGTMQLDGTQVVRAVIPAGLGIRVTNSRLVYSGGTADESKSVISGKVLLPFNTFEDSLPVQFDPDVFLNTFSDKTMITADINIHDKIMGGKAESIKLDNTQKDMIDRGMYYLASRIQANTLKTLPMDVQVQETLSTVPFSVASWNGQGILVNDTTMTPALVGNQDEEIGVTPGRVALDLTRQQAYEGKAPEDTKAQDWMGIVVKNGRVGLPPAFIKTDNDQRVLFNLEPGELLYDRNGVFYQNLAYSSEGIPVNFGDSLGGFKDVTVSMIHLDMYNNKVNLEIHGEMGIPLFGYQRANVRLYTSKELGKLVCSVAETDKFDPSGTGEVLIKIMGGHLQEDGLHMDGLMDLNFAGKLEMQDMQFNELIVPSDMEKMTESGNAEEKYGKALFDKPYRISFHDFEMDVRALSMTSQKQTFNIAVLEPVMLSGYNRDKKLSGVIVPQGQSVTFYQTSMSMWGGMQLSDNLTMNTNEDFDRVVMGGVFTSPTISYEESKSKLDLNFEEFAHVTTVATPVVSSEDDGIVEYNTDSLEMVFKTADKLVPSMPVDANVRMGYDRTMGRYFFALGIYYHDPSGGIQFGYGTINDITGVIGYNLDLVYSDEDGYDFPDKKDGFFNSIDTLEVNRSQGGNYFLAATAWMYFGYDTGGTKVKLGEIRNLYMVVEKGPVVEMGGDYYGPATVQSMVTGKDFKLMGTARLGYYHQHKLFKFSLSLYDFGMYGCTVSGDLGFDMCPSYWEVRVGYPETLTAKAGPYSGGFGVAFRYSTYPDDSYIKAKMHFGYDTGYKTLGPVYFRAYLYAGGEGEYYFDSGNLVLFVYIEGSIEGGVKVGGKKYEIIHLMAGADGTLTRYYGNWNLDANIRIRYHLDLFLVEVGGSVKWHINQDF